MILRKQVRLPKKSSIFPWGCGHLQFTEVKVNRIWKADSTFCSSSGNCSWPEIWIESTKTHLFFCYECTFRSWFVVLFPSFFCSAVYVFQQYSYLNKNTYIWFILITMLLVLRVLLVVGGPVSHTCLKKVRMPALPPVPVWHLLHRN